ncbi:PAS domain-containing sensor histidine kinase [Neptunicoccus cionae]|uniref:PAS domain-containing sensor histidine kinase n=1 Tax=Neptunicoccus cionae TaxID=2035344 RepID=UPI0015E13FB7|nr:PAS domain-containing sensor histidine kinase [Amylibacter cionae]
MSTNPEMWSFVQQASLDGVWYWDLERPDQEWMSPEFWRLFGIDPATKSHNPAEWQDIVNQDDLKIALVNFELHCADPTHPYDQLVRYRHSDGSTIWVRCRGRAIRNDEGKAIRMFGVHNEITAVRRRHETGRELDAANSELRDFAYAVSHDLKSPVNTVGMLLGELQEAEGENLSQDGQHLVALAGESIKRMQIFIEELLRYTSIIGEVVEFVPVSLQSLAEGILEELDEQLRAANVVVDLQPLPQLIAHKEQMRLLLSNLLTNAAKFSRSGSGNRITLSGETTEDNRVILKVADQGVGIGREDFEKIFTIFTRLHRSEQIAGNGLGLALCRRIVMNHGGRITVESDLGAGSCFTVELPQSQT